MTDPQRPIPTRRPVNDLSRGRADERRQTTDGRTAVTPQAAEAEPESERAFPEKPAPVPTNRPVPTFTVHALLDDFPFEVSFSGTAEQFKATVARLRELGAVPPTVAARQAAAAEKARGAPACQCESCDRYGKPMKESTKKPGSFYCPGRTGMDRGNAIYCKERA